MENMFIEFLPPWIETGVQPAFYDKESGTVLQQTARMYAKVNQLVETSNEQTRVINQYINKFNELHDYVYDYFDNLDVQEEINNKIDNMVSDGSFQSILNDYVAPMLETLNDKIDTTALTINEKIDANVANLSSRIASVASGAPIPVSSTSSMTDHNKIYVLTTDGNWYYWNGSAWTAGGIYQASQSTDDVEGLLYNQINENMKYFLGFELGIYNTNNGSSISSNNRIRSKPMVFDYDVFIPHTANVRVNMIYLNSDDSFKSNGSHQANPRKGVFIPKGTHFKLFLDYDVTPEGGRPEIEDVEDSYLFSDFCIIPYSIYKQEQIRVLNRQGITVNPDNLKYQFNMIVGWVGATGLLQNYDYYTRVTCTNIMVAEEDIIFPATTEYDIYLATYTAIDGTGYSGSWVNITTDDLVIPKGTIFDFQISAHPHSNVQSEPTMYDAYNNDLFKALKVYGGNSYGVDDKLDSLKADISVGTLASKYNNTTISTSKISDYMNIISTNTSDNFLFFTDPHTMGSNGTFDVSENNKYLSEIQKYFYQSPCNFIICGGDWLNTGDTPAQAKEKLSVVHGTCKYLFGSDILQLVGNHDVNEYGASGERISSQTVANILNNNHGKNYYRYDSANASYYCLDSDTDSSAMGTYRWEQIDWLGNDLITHDNKHNTIAVHLIYPLSPTNSERTLFANNLDSLISAYNAHSTVSLNGKTYNFTGCSGHIDYTLVGHSHMDFAETLGGVPVIATTYARAGGSASFDLISVDYTAKKFKSIRVGQGGNRTIDL